MRQFFLSVAILILSFSAIAAPDKSRIYVVGVEDVKYYPLYDHTADNQYDGAARAVLDAFAKHSGYTLQYKILPVKRLYEEFLNLQTVDFKFPDSPYWNAGAKEGMQIEYSGPVLEYIDGTMVLKGTFSTLDNFRQLGTMRGYTPYAYLDVMKDKNIVLKENNNFDGLLMQVINKRIDGAYINVAVARYQMKEKMNRPGALVFEPKLPHIKDNYLLSTKKYSEVMADFNKFLETEQETMNKIREEFKVFVD